MKLDIVCATVRWVVDSDMDESLALSVIDCRDSDLPKDNGPVCSCPTPDLDTCMSRVHSEDVYETRVQYDDEDSDEVWIQVKG